MDLRLSVHDASASDAIAFQNAASYEAMSSPPIPATPFPSAPLPSGTVAPDFSLPHEGQEPLSLSQLRGQPVVLAFSPPGWNPDHLEHLALFNEVVAQVQPHGARLLSLEVEGMWCDLDLTDREQLHFPVLRDLDPQGAVAHQYGVDGQRALFVVDAEGVIRWSQVLPAGLPPQTEEILAALRALDPAADKDDVTLDGATLDGGMNEADVPAKSNTFAAPVSRRNFLATAFAATLALTAAPYLEQAGAQSLTSLPQSPASSGPANAAGGAKIPVALRVNGGTYRLNIEPRTSLLDALREVIGLTGTKKGCNQGACGACTVLVNGRRINSCLTLAAMHEGETITTVEGLARGDQLHPVQAAFIEHDGFQCGYCTSGQVVSAVACIQEGHTGSDAEIREWMSGNVCRCGAYPGIVAAVKAAAQSGQAAPKPDTAQLTREMA